MTSQEIRNAREVLGDMWGLGRPLRAAEFGRVLRFSGRDPGRYVLDMEGGKTKVSGPVSLAIEMMIKGARPPALVGMQADEIRHALAPTDEGEATG